MTTQQTVISLRLTLYLTADDAVFVEAGDGQQTVLGVKEAMTSRQAAAQTGLHVQ